VHCFNGMHHLLLSMNGNDRLDNCDDDAPMVDSARTRKERWRIRLELNPPPL
jgi:hypothetical protein